LTLESCIFSGNASGAGGAVYAVGTLTVTASTFYENTSGYRGGAIYCDGSLSLTGNLFYGNTGAENYSKVVYLYGTGLASGYNVFDHGSGINYYESGWSFYPTDTQINTATINATTFRPLATDLRLVPSNLAGYPATDFYGAARSSYVTGGKTSVGAVAAP
jgi:predicted outer membrane repeat protein